jgi:hypothetical protein
MRKHLFRWAVISALILAAGALLASPRSPRHGLSVRLSDDWAAIVRLNPTVLPPELATLDIPGGTLRPLFGEPRNEYAHQKWLDGHRDCWFYLECEGCDPAVFQDEIHKGSSLLDFSVDTTNPMSCFTPNDSGSMYTNATQYYLTRTHSFQAWGIHRNASDPVVIAVLDEGFDMTNPDLAANVWVNPAEDLNHDGIWNDSNGLNDNSPFLDSALYIDDWCGWDFVNLDSANWPNPPCVSAEAADYGVQDNSPFPSVEWINHGTSVALMTGAVTDNGFGIASPSFNSVRLMLCRISYANEFCASMYIVANLRIVFDYAIQSGAKVIVCSKAPLFTTDVGDWAPILDEAADHDVLIVVPSGNENVRHPPGYWYNHPNLLVVSGTHNYDRVELVAHGPDVDISAPAASIEVPCNPYHLDANSCNNNNGFNWHPREGTSLAAPLVAGAAGYIWSLNPSLSAPEIATILRESSDPIYGDTTVDPVDWGSGRLNVFGALLRTPSTSGRKVMQENLEIRPYIAADSQQPCFERPNTLAEKLVVPAGMTLTIFPGVTLNFAAGAGITVQQGGHLVANGTANLPIVLQGENGASWDGFILGGTDASFSYCTFNDVSTAFEVLGGAVTLDECYMNDCWMGALVHPAATLTMTNSGITVENGPYGILCMGHLNMNYSSVQSATRIGVWLAAGLGSATLTGCVIRENGSAQQTSYYRGGIVNTFSGITMTRNFITDNYGPGLSCLGGGADLSGGRTNRPFAGNCIMDNLAAGGEQAQIYRCAGVLSMTSGYNHVCAEDGWLIHDCYTTAVADVSLNNWCGREGVEGALPQNYTFTPIDIAENCPGIEFEPDLDDPPTQAALLYQQAFDAEMNMLYVLAISKYDELMKDYSDSEQAKLCPDRILSCESLSSKDYDYRRGYFLSIADTTSDPQLRFELWASAAWCLVMLKDFDDAHDEFEALLDRAADDYDYQKASLSELMVEIVDAPLDITDGKVSPSRQARVNSILDRADEILSRKYPGNPGKVVPREFALFQNYPNPFNPVTEIRFDLPEAARVELKIFNSLGQLVSTLIDENRAAGSHSVSWDASGVASGVYIYQLRAGSFTDSKKMVLMK